MKKVFLMLLMPFSFSAWAGDSKSVNDPSFQFQDANKAFATGVAPSALQLTSDAWYLIGSAVNLDNQIWGPVGYWENGLFMMRLGDDTLYSDVQRRLTFAKFGDPDKESLAAISMDTIEVNIFENTKRIAQTDKGSAILSPSSLKLDFPASSTQCHETYECRFVPEGRLLLCKWKMVDPSRQCVRNTDYQKLEVFMGFRPLKGGWLSPN